MRGRKPVPRCGVFFYFHDDKKRIPEWGDGNRALRNDHRPMRRLSIKKESPNEGTETRIISVSFDDVFQHIKKESPNKGTETPDH